jgi:hypothetical protein
MVSLAVAEEPPPPSKDAVSTADRTGTVQEASPTPEGDQPKESCSEADSGEELFSPRYRHSLNFVYSRGVKHFDMIEWVSRPDLLTLGDLTSWQATHDYDFDAWLNFDIRWWAGPQGNAHTPVPNLPPQVFDLNLSLSWRQSWADGIATEVTVLPGLYTDFRTTPPDGFRVPGHAVGVFQVGPKLHLVGGVQYVQRNHLQMLPVGGLLWEPDERWQWRLVFPEPKVSYHLDATTDAWVYARGEYGGGRWAYKDDLGHADHVEYSDLRLAVGFESGNLTRAIRPRLGLGTVFFEVGYVFDRHLNFLNGTPQTSVPSGWMISFGCTR